MKNKDIHNTITATELKMNLGKYLDYVIDNHEVIITKHGGKAARLSPYITDMERYLFVKETSLDYSYGGMRVSYDEFIKIYEKSNLRMEYINGEIHLLASPGVMHQKISRSLFLILNSYLAGRTCEVFFAPFDVHFYKQGFKDPDVMQPDLLIACDTNEKTNENGRYMGTPSLVIEIMSRGTRTKDMTFKLNTYMLSGVREYWIVDPEAETVMVYGFKDHEIEISRMYRKGEALESYYFDGLRTETDKIFAP